MTPSGPVALLAPEVCHVSWTRADRWRASVLFAALRDIGSKSAKAGSVGATHRSQEEALQQVYRQLILEQNVGYAY